MKIVNEMPTTGSFLIVWGYNGKPFAQTMYWDEEGCLMELNQFEDVWEESSFEGCPELTTFVVLS